MNTYLTYRLPENPGQAVGIRSDLWTGLVPEHATHVSWIDAYSSYQARQKNLKGDCEYV